MANRLTTAVMDAALDAALSTADHLSLHTGDPGAAGTLLELTNGTAPGYARQTVAFDAAAALSKGNHATVAFVASGGNWPTVTYVGLWHSSTFLGSVALGSSVQANDGQTVSIAAGGLTLTGAVA